jgi:hypothetical protein
MDLNLHQKQGLNHLNKVLNYAPLVAEEGRATVHLTAEDWHVLHDTLFELNTPPHLLPAAVREYRLAGGGRSIEVVTDESVITVDII